MLFTIALLVFAAATPVFSAPVPSTELTRRQGSADAEFVPRHDKLFNGASHHRSKRLVPKERAPKRRQEEGLLGRDQGAVPISPSIPGSRAGRTGDGDDE